MKEDHAKTRPASAGPTDQKRDINSKAVLGNPILYAQFLRDNINIPFLKNVQPEDIEDVSERYRPYLGTEFESDTVKRVWIHQDNNTDSRTQEPLFLISLTEHKSQVDYDVAMQLLKYMLCIWLDYGKERKAQKAGASDRKGFRYPAIIPIVYYEGKPSWTADRQFRARISGGDVFYKWIPIMLFNKIQDVIDLSEFLKLPQESLSRIVRDTPEAIIDIIVSVMESLCGKIDATEEETRKCVSKVKERKMGYLFENMEKMSIQEERRNTALARAEVERVKIDAEKAKKEALEDKISLIIEYCKRLKISKDQTVQELTLKCGIDPETAQKKIDLYWL